MEQGEKRREDRTGALAILAIPALLWWVLMVESERLASTEQLHVCACSVHRTRRGTDRQVASTSLSLSLSLSVHYICTQQRNKRVAIT